MRVSTIILGLIVTIYSNSLIAQQRSSSVRSSECATVVTPEVMEYFERYRPAWKEFSIKNAEKTTFASELTMVPIKAHIVRRTNGTGGLAVSVLENELKVVNSFYKNAGIEFFLCGGINFINNDNLFDLDIDTEESDLAKASFFSSAINVYFCNDVIKTVDGKKVSICGQGNFPSEGLDKVIMNSDPSCSANGSTFAHELGHFFSLFHTHETKAKGNEHVTRSAADLCFNCDTTGDFLCDTPADPKLDSSDVTISISCTYSSVLTDACGVLYNPMVDNVMSYAPKECRTSFTLGQYKRINFCLKNQRNYLKCCDKLPSTVAVSGWDVNKAMDIEIGAGNTLQASVAISSSMKTVFKSGGNIVLSTGFRVFKNSPFQASIGCAAPKQLLFALNSETISDENLLNLNSKKSFLNVYPNPSSGLFTFEYTLEAETEVSLSVYDTQGKKVEQLLNKTRQKAGTHRASFDASRLKNDVYMYLLEAGTRKESGKLVKAR